jgi:hypothetical protein
VPVFSLTDAVTFIENVFGHGELARDGLNIAVRCPIPDCDSRKDRSKRKLAIRTDDWRVHCWVCGHRARSLVPLLRRFASKEVFNDYCTRFLDKKHVTYDAQGTDEPTDIHLPSGFRLLTEASRSDPDAADLKTYLANERNLLGADGWRYGLGYVPRDATDDYRWKRRVIMPSFDAQGNLNYFTGRAIDRRRRPKYDNPSVDRTSVIFNELNVDWTRRVVLCEGPFDMVNCGDNAVPLLGSELNEQYAVFEKLLVHSTPVAMALDSDVWATKTLRIAKRLVGYGLDVVIVDTRSFTDPGNATREQFAEALACAKPYDWADALATKLAAAAVR